MTNSASRAADDAAAQEPGAPGTDSDLDALCRVGAGLVGVPVALISLVEGAALRLHGRYGPGSAGIDPATTPCAGLVRGSRPHIVADLAADTRHAGRPVALAAGQARCDARFYAGIPLVGPSGAVVGVLALLDVLPRPDLAARARRCLPDLARLAEGRLNLRAAETALHERETRLRAAAAARALAEETASFGHWRLDTLRRTIAWSEGVARVYGRNPGLEVLCLDTHLGFYHPEDRAAVAHRIAETVAGRSAAPGGGYTHRSRILRPDGEVRTLQVHCIADRDAQGRVTALHGVCLDVSDLARSERQQRETGVLLRATLEAMDQGLVMTGPDERVRVFNRRAVELMGLPEDLLREDLPFQAVRRFQTEAGEFDALAPELRQWLQTGDPSRRVSEYERERPNGTVLEVRTVLLPDGGLVRTFTDVSERRRRERALRAAEAERRTLFENAVIGVFRADLDGRILSANRALARLHGYSDGATPLDRPGFGHDWYLEPDRHALFRRRLLDEGRVEDFVSEIRAHASGEAIWVSETAWAVRGPNGRIVGFEGMVADATERKRAETVIEQMARHDPLTGLPNRRLFHEVLRRELEGAREAGTEVAVLCCDLDRFKAVNDTFGHAAGDALLRVLAERLRAVLRPADTVARLGGDEFAIVLPLGDGPETARQVAHQVARGVIEAVARPIEATVHPATVGVSIGIAVGPGDGDTLDHLFKNADIALYRAKDAGRNTFRFYERGMDAAIAARNILELDLREAVRAGSFVLHYQPILDLARDTTVGFEALLRWRDPVRGMVPPAAFIPLAEETGLIVPLGAWALQAACHEAAGWPGEARVAVNVSAVQFRQPGLEQAVLRALSASGLAPGRLELEITESVIMQDSAAAMACLHRLKALGVRIALDDFGTGYSSLSYLRRFPFDKIKIDRAFIRDIADPDAAAIVQAIVGLGTRLGATITAEGVETREQLEQVRRQNCTEVQGYLYGRPMPAEEARALLTGRVAAAA